MTDSSGPTTQALIDQLEYASAMTPHRGYSALFAAAADALRSLQQREVANRLGPVTMAGIAADLKAECERQHARAERAEAEVARLTREGKSDD